ncbi:hypothetical protein NC652_008212 [Populus alba x Populus x berolinensis]|nr:hypothetical protein NC652_008212 [Populus alba x Populus x berolinensis]
MTFSIGDALTPLKQQATNSTRRQLNYSKKFGQNKMLRGFQPQWSPSLFQRAFSLSRGSCTTPTDIVGWRLTIDHVVSCQKPPEEYQDSLGLYLAFGALAGLFGSTCTYPSEVVRRQSSSLHSWFYKVDCLRQGEAYSSTRRELTSVFRNQGRRQLYAGLRINNMKAVPSLSIGFTAYDVMKSWLHIQQTQ